jgi:hypothetical protein
MEKCLQREKRQIWFSREVEKGKYIFRRIQKSDFKRRDLNRYRTRVIYSAIRRHVT